MKRLLYGSFFVGIITLVATNQFKKTSSSQDLSSRRPASTEDLFLGVDKALRDLQNDAVFNPSTCPAYIDGVTKYLYGLKSDYFVPKTAQETETLMKRGVELRKSIFQVRLQLREKFQQFDEQNTLTPECLQKVKEGIRYSRITEEYLLDWLVRNKAVPLTSAKILEADPNFTLTNPKFEGFKLQTGDLIMVRGKSFVSAMIARIADEESNFSHLAIIGEDSKGKQYAVESLIQTGVIITPLEEWRKSEDSRVVLFRQRDPELAKRAGRLVYDYTRSRIDKEGEIQYDFSMNDRDHKAIFCAEVAAVAYEKASGGTMVLPKFKSTIHKFKNTNFPASMGIKTQDLFAPYDIEFDPRFDFIAEYKFYPLLRQVRMQDAVFQSINTWLVSKNYEFHFNLPSSAKSYLGKFLRQFGFFVDTMPKYMPVQTINTVAQFQSVSTALEKNLFAKEDEFYKKNGYLPTFSEFIEINEKFRKQDCLDNQGAGRLNPADFVNEFRGLGNKSKFHWFFYSKNQSCD